MTTSPTTLTLKLPPITPSQGNILKLLYIHRFLSSNQIQVFLHHGDKSKINKWLADLSNKGYINRRFANTLVGNTKPAAYSCALGAIRHFKTTDYACEAIIKRLYKDTKRAGSFITANLLLADMAIQLRDVTNRNLRFEFATSSLYSHPASRANFLAVSRLSPSAVIIKDDGGTYSPYLLEIIPYGIPANRLYGKINGYLSLYFSGDWQQHMALTFPKIFIACATTKQIEDASHFALLKLRHTKNTDDLKIVFVLSNALKRNGLADRLLSDQEKTARQ